MFSIFAITARSWHRNDRNGDAPKVNHCNCMHRQIYYWYRGYKKPFQCVHISLSVFETALYLNIYIFGIFYSLRSSGFFTHVCRISFFLALLRLHLTYKCGWPRMHIIPKTTTSRASSSNSSSTVTTNGEQHVPLLVGIRDVYVL